MRAYLLPVLVLIAAGVAGCSSGTTTTYISGDSVTNYITIHNGIIAVHAPDRADADITATGDLSISGTSVTVTDAQRDLLKHYYSAAVALRDHGIATGNAGIATAGKAISSVASGLLSGNTDKIDGEVNASAAKVEAKVALICTDLAELRSNQETLAAQLPAFQPYAVIKADDADDCQHDVRDHHRA